MAVWVNDAFRGAYIDQGNIRNALSKPRTGRRPDDHAALLVISLAQRLASCIAILSLSACLTTEYQAGAIRKMFVKKEFRGKELGVAQQLLNTLIEHCRELGITDLYLGTVDMLKAAHRFYEKNGFNRINAEDLPSYFPRMMADNVFYHLHLGV